MSMGCRRSGRGADTDTDSATDRDRDRSRDRSSDRDRDKHSDTGSVALTGHQCQSQSQTRGWKSFSERKRHKELGEERRLSGMSCERSEHSSLPIAAAPLNRSPSFTFQAWAKTAPRPFTSSVQYKSNASQSLEFYVDRATGLPENCTVSRHVELCYNSLSLIFHDKSAFPRFLCPS